MSARACVCNFCIRILVDFGKNVIRFFWGLCFSFGASISHFQGSISNARGTFEPKTPPSSPLTAQNLANNVPWGVQKWIKNNFVIRPIREPVKNYLADFSANLFWAQ